MSPFDLFNIDFITTSNRGKVSVSGLIKNKKNCNLFDRNLWLLYLFFGWCHTCMYFDFRCQPLGFVNISW